MMNLDTTVYRHKTEDWVSIDRLTATCKRVVNALHALINDECIV